MLSLYQHFCSKHALFDLEVILVQTCSIVHSEITNLCWCPLVFRLLLVRGKAKNLF